jgi:hypothetical protein
MTDESSEILEIDGEKFSTANISDQQRALLAMYVHAHNQLMEAANMRAVLTRARNSYIHGLKAEITQTVTGVNLSELFGD